MINEDLEFVIDINDTEIVSEFIVIDGQIYERVKGLGGVWDDTGRKDGEVETMEFKLEDEIFTGEVIFSVEDSKLIFTGKGSLKKK